MSKIMLQFRSKEEAPSLEHVCESFGLQADDVDVEYGVVQTDSREGLFVILVDETVRPLVEEKLKLMGADTDPKVGLFANPRIEPFGPPK